MSNKCGECEEYYCCKSDLKLQAKYLPKNKKACGDFNPSREYLQAENKRLKESLKHIDTCLLILTNTKTEEDINDLPKLLKRLKEYVEQVLEGGGRQEDARTPQEASRLS